MTNDVIHKFVIPGAGEAYALKISPGDTVLSVGEQDGKLVAWVLVNRVGVPSGQCNRLIAYGTGWDLPERSRWFIGTVQTAGGFVWHCFLEPY